MSRLPSREEFRIRMREVWSDHTKYTAMVISAVLSNTDTADFLVRRLLEKNQEDIGANVAHIISTRHDAREAAKFGSKLTNLLKTHIKLAATITREMYNLDDYFKDFVKFEEKSATSILLQLTTEAGHLVYTDDNKKFRELGSKPANKTSTAYQLWMWYDNADDIATLIAKSEYAKKGTFNSRVYIREGLFKHLDQTFLQILLYYKKLYGEWVEMMDRSTNHILEFSDILTGVFFDE
jgi:hypothetical protein